jgi:DNA-binding MurR/RpiR family transcriptional regulator
MKRDILRIIEENMDGFSKGQRQIARYLLSHYDKAAYMTAAKLGAEVSVSESTVVRFVMELGYAGYPEFQKALQELIRTKLTSFQRMEVTNHLIGDGDVLEKVLNTNVDNIRHTLESISRAAFHDAVEAMVKAKNIYIIGVRSSAMLAGFLSYSLQMIFDNVRLIEDHLRGRRAGGHQLPPLLQACHQGGGVRPPRGSGRSRPDRQPRVPHRRLGPAGPHRPE